MHRIFQTDIPPLYRKEVQTLSQYIFFECAIIACFVYICYQNTSQIPPVRVVQQPQHIVTVQQPQPIQTMVPQGYQNSPVQPRKSRIKAPQPQNYTHQPQPRPHDFPDYKHKNDQAEENQDSDNSESAPTHRTTMGKFGFLVKKKNKKVSEAKKNYKRKHLGFSPRDL